MLKNTLIFWIIKNKTKFTSVTVFSVFTEKSIKLGKILFHYLIFDLNNSNLNIYLNENFQNY
jgi:hypothetical protein